VNSEKWCGLRYTFEVCLRLLMVARVLLVKAQDI
jgi:hypothetical protein